MNAVCLRFKLFSNRSVYVMGIEFISGRLLKHRWRGWLKHSWWDTGGWRNPLLQASSSSSSSFFLFLIYLLLSFFFKFSQLPLGWSSCLRCWFFFFLVTIGVEQLSPLLINHKTRWLTIRWKRAKEESVLKSWNWEKRGSEWPIENFEGVIVISSWCRYLLYWVVSTSKKLTWREWLIRYFLPKQRVGMT